MPRTISDIRVPNRSPADLWPVATGWLGQNEFSILSTRSDGKEQNILHWDGTLTLHPRPGSCVAIRQMAGGGTIVFEISMVPLERAASVHLEGYVTSRGPGWRGKEYDLIPRRLAVAGVLRRRGLLLSEDLQQSLLTARPTSLPTAAPGPLRGASSASGILTGGTCSSCRGALPPRAKFCPNCGTPAPARSIPSSGASAPSPVAGPPMLREPVPAVRGGRGAPSLPLLPGETLLQRYASSTEGQKRVMTYNLSIMVGVISAVLVPFAVLSFTSKGLSPIVLLYLYPVALIGGMTLYQRRAIARKGPTTVFVTDRRILVDQPGKEGSATMMLENVSRVDIDVQSRAARRAGVAWVFILPHGTPAALTGRGRARRAAPGVIWVPAVPLDTANAMQSLIVTTARGVQEGLGYPPESRAN